MQTPTVTPRKTWLKSRFEEVCTAIAAQYEALQPIPVEWVEEYNWLVAELKPVPNAD